MHVSRRFSYGKRKKSYGSGKIVMEMSNIMVLNARPELVKNVLLYSLLFKQCGTAEGRSDIIQQLILDHIHGDNEPGALSSCLLLWPSILESTLLEGPEGIHYFIDREGKDACLLYDVDLKESGASKLDAALVEYAKRLDQLIMATFIWLKPGIRCPKNSSSLPRRRWPGPPTSSAIRKQAPDSSGPLSVDWLGITIR